MTPVRVLVVVHRWLGIALCLLFAVWFASGAIMIYVPFPSLKDTVRIDRMSLVDMERVAVPPDAAIRASGSNAIERERLIQGPDRPIYVVTPQSGAVVAVGADNGQILPRLSADEAALIAGEFTHTGVKSVEGPFDYDQWVVHQRFDPYRPVYRVGLNDDDGTWLYVSARSGDVLQMTTRTERRWNYVGAVAHWLYPTVLRQSWWWWDKVVWTLSLTGIVVAVAGAILGIIRSSRSLKSDRRPSISPFRGWFRWHHISGLIGGIVLITWIFSGWLSMDHARLFSTGMADREQTQAYRGLTVEAAAQATTLGALHSLPAMSEAEIIALDGQGYVIGRAPGGRLPTIVSSAGDGKTRDRFDDTALLSAVNHAWPGSGLIGIGGIPPDDAYGHLITDPLPVTTRRIVLGTTPPVWVHVDSATGQILQVTDRSRRLYRWLFTALHDFDLPALYGHEGLRQTLALTLLGAGFLLSITGVVIGVKRLLRSVPPLRRSARRPSKTKSLEEYSL